MIKFWVSFALLFSSVAFAEQKSDYFVRRNGQDYLLVVRANGTPYKSSIWYKARAVTSIEELTDRELRLEREENRKPLAVLYRDAYQRYYVVFTNDFYSISYSREDLPNLYEISFFEYIWSANFYALEDISLNDIFVLAEEVPGGPPPEYSNSKN